MIDSDGHSSLHDGQPVMDTASGSRSLPSRLEQALHTDGPATTDQLTMVYRSLPSKFDAVSASFRQAATAPSANVGPATFKEN